MSEVTLSRAAKTRAVRAIESVHALYSDQDGLAEMIQRAEDLKTRVSSQVHGLAVFAVKTEKTLERGIALYLAMCTYAEEAYKTKHGVTDLEKAIPVWKVYKSNILSAMRLDLNPAEYNSEYELRKAKNELTESPIQVKPPIAPATPAKARAGPATEQQIEQMLSGTAVHDRLRTLVARIIFSAEFLRRNKVSEAEAIIQEAVDKRGALVDHRRVA
jgi:hypothetical protein